LEKEFSVSGQLIFELSLCIGGVVFGFLCFCKDAKLAYLLPPSTSPTLYILFYFIFGGIGV
jgi:hypothetical protein